MSSSYSNDDAAFTHMMDILFMGARDTTFSIPDEYHLSVMRGMLRFAMEQLYNGTEKHKEIIYAAYQKWAGEAYESDSGDSD